MLEMFVADTLFQSGGLGGGGGGGRADPKEYFPLPDTFSPAGDIMTGGSQAFNAGQNGAGGSVLNAGNGGMLLAVVITSVVVQFI